MMANSSEPLQIQIGENGTIHYIEAPNPPGYLDLKRIAAGTHGTCYYAVDDASETKRKVAIKRIVLHPTTTDKLKRAAYEIYILQRVRHENVIRLLDLLDVRATDLGSRSAYVVMEPIQSDLCYIIQKPEFRNLLTKEHISFITCGALRGLKYLHSAHVIHRDLKPANILINTDCVAKICDLGLARVAPPVLFENETLMTANVVTPAYRAPEVALTPGRYNPTMDVWSVGCILAEMITGKILFHGKNDADQVVVIIDVLGTPNAGQIESLGVMPAEHKTFLDQLPRKKKQPWSAILPEQNSNVYDFMETLLTFSPSHRTTAANALKHPYLAKYCEEDDDNRCPTPLAFELKGESQEELTKFIEEEIQDYRKSKT